MCVSVTISLKHFFISIDDEKGDSFTKRAGRKAFIITGLVLMILGTLITAAAYGAFPGVAVLGTLASVGIIGGYAMTFTGSTLFILGVVREVLARERAKKIGLGSLDRDTIEESEEKFSSGYFG